MSRQAPLADLLECYCEIGEGPVTKQTCTSALHKPNHTSRSTECVCGACLNDRHVSIHPSSRLRIFTFLRRIQIPTFRPTDIFYYCVVSDSWSFLKLKDPIDELATINWIVVYLLVTLVCFRLADCLIMYFTLQLHIYSSPAALFSLKMRYN
jgi:hypothetical protein